jgi:hypothetical protein
MATARGKTLEDHIDASLRHVAAGHPGLVEVRVHREIALLSGTAKRPVFELIFRLEQEHRELIAVQGHDPSPAELLVNVRIMKNFSPNSRFVFVFEAVDSFSPAHKLELEQEGVECLSPAEFDQKLKRLDDVLMAEKMCVRPRWSGPTHKRVVFG